MILLKHILLLLSCGITFLSYSQTETLLQHNDSLVQLANSALNSISYAPSGKAKVHPFYINTDFTHSYVINQKDEIIYFSGRYNVLKKSIEAQLDEGLRIIKLNQVKLAQIGRTTLLPIPRTYRPQVDNNSFVEVLSVGKINLFRNYLLASKMELGGSLSMQADGKKVYYVDEKIYYSTDFQTFTHLKKKNIMGLLGEFGDAIEQLMEEENLKLNDVVDLQRILNYYNEISVDREDEELQN